jgi:hypothetical protein
MPEVTTATDDPITERTKRLLAAVHIDRDAVFARYYLQSLPPEELIEVALFLAERFAPPAIGSDDALVSFAVKQVSRLFNVGASDIKSANRKRDVLDARQVTCYAAHLLGVSYSSIGRHLDLHHTTVMAACSRVGESSRLRQAAQNIARQGGWTHPNGAGEAKF